MKKIRFMAIAVSVNSNMTVSVDTQSSLESIVSIQSANAEEQGNKKLPYPYWCPQFNKYVTHCTGTGNGCVLQSC